MGWGGGYGYHVPQTAKDVAKAFYAGRVRNRSNCWTDGESYWLEGNMIAHRVRPEHELEEIAKALQGKAFRRSLEFSFCGWPTQTTCRHLLALGVDASLEREYRLGPRGGFDRSSKEEIALMNGRKVDPRGWYTLEELAEMPKWSQPQPVVLPRAKIISPQNLELAFG